MGGILEHGEHLKYRLDRYPGKWQGLLAIGICADYKQRMRFDGRRGGRGSVMIE